MPQTKDGLYQVTTHYLCAGFVVERGHVTLCAPILGAKLAYWRTVAQLVAAMTPADAQALEALRDEGTRA